ncbi:MAG: hypothetical protein EXR93_08275 [Gemmatimonadetes bacterium]|nr:hypothetical protein [Gemmatimonadota bacterium]
MVRRAIMPLAAASLLTFLPSVLRAQDAPTSINPKHAEVAVAISLIATVGPTVLGATMGSGWLASYGLFLGPSTGFLYVGKPGRVLGGGLVRVAVTAATVLGITAACGGDLFWSCDDEGAANAVALLGLGAFAASAIYDIVAAGRAASRWRPRTKARHVTVMPGLNPFARSGSLAVRITF